MTETAQQERDAELTLEESLRLQLQNLSERHTALAAKLDKTLVSIDEANIKLTALNELRNGLSDQLFQEKVARKTEAANTALAHEQEIKKITERNAINLAAQQQQTTLLQRELDETRQTFGAVKSAQKNDQSRATLNAALLNWLISVSAAYGQSIPRGLTDPSVFTVEGIEAAYHRMPTVPDKLTTRDLNRLFSN